MTSKKIIEIRKKKLASGHGHTHTMLGQSLFRIYSSHTPTIVLLLTHIRQLLKYFPVVCRGVGKCSMNRQIGSKNLTVPKYIPYIFFKGAALMLEPFCRT